jgi:hypothetical protein
MASCEPNMNSILSLTMNEASVSTVSPLNSYVVSTCQLAGIPGLAMLVNTGAHLGL